MENLREGYLVAFLNFRDMALRACPRQTAKKTRHGAGLGVGFLVPTLPRGNAVRTAPRCYGAERRRGTALNDVQCSYATPLARRVTAER